MLKRKIIRTLLILNILISALIVISVISPYIPPSKIWFIALFGLAYRYFLIAGFAFILIWLIFRKNYAILSVALMLPSLLQLSEFIQLHPSREPDKSMFKFMTFNVWNLSRSNSMNVDTCTMDSIFQFINNEGPDIVCLQEFALPGNIKENIINFPTATIHLPYYNYSKYSKKSRRVDGLVTFSRFPIFHRDTMVSPENKTFAQISDVIVRNRILRIINIQLTSNKLNTNDSLYIEDFKLDTTIIKNKKRLFFFKIKNACISREKLINRIVARIKTSPYPVLLTGDFNDTPVSYTHRVACKGRKDAYSESGFGFGNTYFGNKAPSYRIDYVIYDKMMKSINFKVHHIELSDHYPVTVMLGFRY